MRPTLASPAPFFARTLKLRSTGSDVRALQTYLNNHAFFIGKNGPGSPGHETTYFGVGTRLALLAFQTHHAADILLPFGLKKGNGILSGATRAFINASLQAPSSTTNVPRTTPPAPSKLYTIGGSITGISGTVILQNNQDDFVTVQPGTNSTFTFPKPLVDGQSYIVTIRQAPTGTRCFTAHSNTGVNILGTVHGDNVTDIVIQCGAPSNPFQYQSSGGGGGGGSAPRTFTVGGSVSHLTGSLTLQSDTGATLTLSSSGAFAFPSFGNGQLYSISILTQPEGETCSISHGSGIVVDNDVTSVTVNCLTITTIHTTDITVNNAVLETVISPPAFFVRFFDQPRAYFVRSPWVLSYHYW